jgi:hypothetical protein
MKGMIVNIYKHNKHDTTNSGVTSQAYDALLVGEGIPEIFEASGRPILKLVKRHLFGNPVPYLHVQPVEGTGYMFGGNFVYSSDSRFPNDYPLPVHDRQE